MRTRSPWPSIRTANDAVLVALFALGIGLPLVGLWTGAGLGVGGDDGRWENRRYASAPRLAWTRASVAQFPEQLEAYFDDHFAFRAVLIRWDNILRTVVLGASPEPGSGQSPGTRGADRKSVV